MNPDDDKKIIYDEDEIDTTLDTMLGPVFGGSIDVGSIDISSKDYKYSLGEWRVDVRLNKDVLLEAFKSIAFEEPNDLAKTLIEYYYELKHNPEGERINLLKKKLEDEYNINL